MDEGWGCVARSRGVGSQGFIIKPFLFFLAYGNERLTDCAKGVFLSRALVLPTGTCALSDSKIPAQPATKSQVQSEATGPRDNRPDQTTACRVRKEQPSSSQSLKKTTPPR